MPYGSEEFDRLIHETLRALRPEGHADADGDPVPEIRGEGAGLDGLVRVAARPGGRLESLEIDPRAMRTDSHTLAEELLTAANAALEDLQRQVGQVAGAGPDPGRLMERLQEVQNSAVPRMESFLRAVESLRSDVSSRHR